MRKPQIIEQELKFRAFHKEYGLIYDVFSFCSEFVKYEVNGTVYKDKRSNFEPLMQYIGVKYSIGLCKGDKIFVGDIVKHGNRIGEIIFDCNFGSIGFNVYSKSDKFKFPLNKFNVKHLKKIGDIYNNKNLNK